MITWRRTSAQDVDQGAVSMVLNHLYEMFLQMILQDGRLEAAQEDFRSRRHVIFLQGHWARWLAESKRVIGED